MRRGPRRGLSHPDKVREEVGASTCIEFSPEARSRQPAYLGRRNNANNMRLYEATAWARCCSPIKDNLKDLFEPDRK